MGLTDWECTYRRLPVALQHVVCSIWGFKVNRQRYGGDYGALLAEVELRATWSGEQAADYRDARLRRFVRHCWETVPFYRDQLRDAGVGPLDIRSLGDLEGLPVLSKAEVQDAGNRLVSSAIPPRWRVTAHTSGTTGAGLRFATTTTALREQWAVWWRYRRWHGIQPGTWCGYFGGRPVVPVSQRVAPYWRYNWPARQILFSAYHLNESAMADYLGKLRRSRPPWLHGYPSALALVAAHLVDRGTDLGYQPRWVTTGAENLLPHQSTLLERAFGVKPIQHYGLAEAVANASECTSGHLHLDEDFAAVEFLPRAQGGLRIVGCNLSNWATPLLRYDAGDIAASIDGPCPCGRPGRLVARVDGRMEDYVVLADGSRVGRLDHIFKDLTRVREAQIQQGRAGEVLFRIVRGPGYCEDDERALLREARRHLGGDMRFRVHYPDSLERSRDGKLRLVIPNTAET